MGQKAARKKAFLAAHPICAFCGVAPATTEDHVPARVFFANRQAPDGYIFPACDKCNRKDRDAEQVVAFHLYAIKRDSPEFMNVYQGVKNNRPDALPNPFLTPGQKAKALLARGIRLPASALASAPVVSLSPEMSEDCHRFAGKLTKALYYRLAGRPVPPGFRIVTHWTTADQPGATDLLKTMFGFMPGGEIGARTNVDLGEQFAYRYNVSAGQEVFVFTAGLSNVLFFTGMCARGGDGLDFEKFLTLPSWREAS